jgi:hypothetical protein
VQDGGEQHRRVGSEEERETARLQPRREGAILEQARGHDCKRKRLPKQQTTGSVEVRQHESLPIEHQSPICGKCKIQPGAMAQQGTAWTGVRYGVVLPTEQHREHPWRSALVLQTL